MSNRVLLSLLAFVIAFFPGWSEPHAQVPTFRSKTDVVLVPVIVRNKSGPVEGLKAEQFSVTEDGKPQKIASVELIRTATDLRRRDAPGEFSNELLTTGPARLTIIGIDMINTPFLDQTFARQQLLKYLGSSVKTDEQTAIFGMYRDGSVRLLHDISTDSAMLASAIQAVTGRLTNSATDTKTTPTYSKMEIERMLMSVNPNQEHGSGDPNLSRVAEEMQALQSFKESTGGSAAADDLRRNMEATLSCMRQIGAAFWGAPGRKAFIWITGSFPFDIDGSGELLSPKAYFMGITQENGAYYRQHSGALPPMPDASSMVNDADLSPLRQQFRTLLQQFASGNIVLYPLDARGLMTVNFEAADADSNPLLLKLDRDRVKSSQLTMETVARMTGGKACYDKNEIVSCVRDASHDAVQYYLLSYYRDKKANKPGWRKLSVKVDAADVEVRSRTGYFYGNDPGDKNAHNRAISLAMQSSVPLSAVPFSARFLAATAEGAKKLVKYQVYIPPQTVDLADQGDSNFQFEVIAVAGTAKDSHVDQVAQVVGGNLPPAAVAAIHQQGIAYKNALKLSPGEYSVRFMVRIVATNLIGSVIAPLKVE